MPCCKHKQPAVRLSVCFLSIGQNAGVLPLALKRHGTAEAHPSVHPSIHPSALLFNSLSIFLGAGQVTCLSGGLYSWLAEGLPTVGMCVTGAGLCLPLRPCTPLRCSRHHQRVITSSGRSLWLRRLIGRHVGGRQGRTQSGRESRCLFAATPFISRHGRCWCLYLDFEIGSGWCTGLPACLPPLASLSLLGCLAGWLLPTFLHQGVVWCP
mmetsp:Transcript_6614/g.15997  ORF Transcript_6614/g.15997 Transcript_6614/m.15997 type:complete len:210 (-) Transcript_6614:1122-1751(-)